MAQVVEPESEKFALSPSADLEEIREFLRCESLERMQLCMRLQKQQELLEELSEGLQRASPPLKCQDVTAIDRTQDARIAGLIAAAEGSWRKQLGAEVDALKLSVENLTQDVKELQDSLDTPERMDPSGGSLVLHKDECEDQADPIDQDLDFEGIYEPALDLQWLEERFEEVQKQWGAETVNLEERLMEDFGNLKGFVDAAIVAVVSRMSTLEIFVKGEGGLIEKIDELREAVANDTSNSQRRIDSSEDRLKEAHERLNTLEKRIAGVERPSSVAFSPPLAYRPLKPKGIESSESAVLEKHPEAVLSPPQRVLSHGPAPLTPGMALPLGSHAPPGSLKVPPPGAWGSPVHPAFRLGGASSSQLVTVLATPRPSSPTRTLREVPVPGVPGRAVTPSRFVRAPAPQPVPALQPAVRF